MFVICSSIRMSELKFIVSFITIINIANEGRHVRIKYKSKWNIGVI